MKKPMPVVITTSVIVVLLMGCTVTRQDVGLGAGGIAGGVIGSAVTGGSTAGTIVGAVGGAFAGSAIANHY